MRLLTVFILLGLLDSAWANDKIKGLKTDPTKPKVILNLAGAGESVDGEAEPEQDELQLQAITLAGEHYNAVIDGKLVRVGDQLNAAVTIVNIALGQVTIDNQGNREVLTLAKASVKQQAKGNNEN